MKTLTVFIIAMLFPFLVLSQEGKQLKETTVPPNSFTNDNSVQENQMQNSFTFENYLKEQLMAKARSFNGASEGTEVVRFEVSLDGNLIDFEVINSVSSQVDHAVYEILRSACAIWNPVEINGKEASAKREVSVEFKMVENTDFDELATKYLTKGREELFENENPKKALRYFNQGIKYRPNYDCLLLARGVCKYEMDDKEGAKADWNRMAMSGISDNAKTMIAKCCDMKGYTELLSYIEAD